MSKNEKNLIISMAAGFGAVCVWKLWKKMRPKYSFSNKVVLITGGSRGLGLVLARNFAHSDVTVNGSIIYCKALRLVTINCHVLKDIQ